MTLSSDRWTRPAGPAVRRVASSPRCAQCGSGATEPVTTMRLHTCDAEEWFRCDECGQVFSTSRFGEP